jgi:hypothetical protein
VGERVENCEIPIRKCDESIATWFGEWEYGECETIEARVV